jgi:predicted O-methyltransferase YrrM
MDVFPPPMRRFVAAVSPEPTPLQREMAEVGREQNFPILGPEAGGLALLFTRMVAAEHVFEFGSGFGYSATWFLRGLAPDGDIVLTELDADEIDMGREFLARAGETDRVTYEHGDALDAIERYDGPFDVVLVDHQKHRYRETFERVEGKVAPGGVVVADNMMAGPFDFDDVLAGLEGDTEGLDGAAAGVVDYLTHVRDAPGYTSTVLPIGEGLAVSHRRR